jgi:phosphate transport system permease protein
VLTGALTLVLVILPVIIISTQEALRAVPYSLREAAWGLGLTRWQTVWRVVFPSALPTVMTGTILSISRAVGEAAPLLMIAGIVFISNPPGNIMDDFTAMPLQIYNWAQRPQQEFHDLAASGIVVLLTMLLCFNAIAVIIRNKAHKSLS